MSHVKNILLHPEAYIGSMDYKKELTWIYDVDNDMMVQKYIDYVPGLYTIFNEILLNAVNCKQGDKKTDCIKVEIQSNTNTISVWNNGQSISMVMSKAEAFTTCFNSGNEEANTVDGIELCNIFSSKFTLKTASKEHKQHFEKTWKSNMTIREEIVQEEYFDDDFTMITFSPDLTKFTMKTLDEDIVALMSRRVYDIAATTQGIQVFLNRKQVQIESFNDYINLYIKNRKNYAGSSLKAIHENVSESWKVALTFWDKGFQQVSFVNNTATFKGGRHVDYIKDIILKQLIKTLKEKYNGINIKPLQLKNHMWLFLNCKIVNSTFDSPLKEHMISSVNSFNVKCKFSEKFISTIIADCIGQLKPSWLKTEKQSKPKSIPNLEDAHEAGTENASRCTLILTMGGAGKVVAVCGLSVTGRDYYGVLSLKNKLLNIREITQKQALENVDIDNITKTLGLRYEKDYNTAEDLKTLRYGKVMIMADPNEDGSYYKGLLINFIHYYWPSLLRQNFLDEFIVPIVKIGKEDEVLLFYSLDEFYEWKFKWPAKVSYTEKFYRFLGTMTSAEVKQYFLNMERHRISFHYSGQEDDDHIKLAFSKEYVDDRKEWLRKFMVEGKFGISKNHLYSKNTRYVNYKDFVNLELAQFFIIDNLRSIPCLVDGLKPGQRKVLYTCFKRNDQTELRAVQMAGSVAEHAAYFQDELSLCRTIIQMAQTFIGSNNINLLEPHGQFGTRAMGGEDCASPRYIFTKMSAVTRSIFDPSDDALLKYQYDNNQKIEPVWYIPIVPMILINGADGVGSGWTTKIPNYNPHEIVLNLYKMLNGEEPTPMLPWYKNFTGTIKPYGSHLYETIGEIAVTGDNEIEITELPVGTWTEDYKKDVLEPLLHGSEEIKSVISNYEEYHTESTVKFAVTCHPGQLPSLEKDGLHKIFKLQSIIDANSMWAFDEAGNLKWYESEVDILKDFYQLRLKMYYKRQEYLKEVLEAEAKQLNNQVRFLLEKCNGELGIENQKYEGVVEELVKRGYDPDPIAAWKTKKDQYDEESENRSHVEYNETLETGTQLDKFDYFLGFPMWMLTKEKKDELTRQRDAKVAELEILRQKTPADLWRADLDAFIKNLNLKEDRQTHQQNKSAETMPMPGGRRIVPIIGENLNKVIMDTGKMMEKLK